MGNAIAYIPLNRRTACPYHMQPKLDDYLPTTQISARVSMQCSFWCLSFVLLPIPTRAGQYHLLLFGQIPPTIPKERGPKQVTSLRESTVSFILIIHQPTEEGRCAHVVGQPSRCLWDAFGFLASFAHIPIYGDKMEKTQMKILAALSRRLDGDGPISSSLPSLSEQWLLVMVTYLQLRRSEIRHISISLAEEHGQKRAVALIYLFNIF